MDRPDCPESTKILSNMKFQTLFLYLFDACCMLQQLSNHIIQNENRPKTEKIRGTRLTAAAVMEVEKSYSTRYIKFQIGVFRGVLDL